MTKDTIEALDTATWDAFAALMERHNGVFGGFWCTWFHTLAAEKGCATEDIRDLKQRLVRQGHSHAALVFDGNQTVAWCQFGSPQELAEHLSPQAVRG